MAEFCSWLPFESIDVANDEFFRVIPILGKIMFNSFLVGSFGFQRKRIRR